MPVSLEVDSIDKDHDCSLSDGAFPKQVLDLIHGFLLHPFVDQYSRWLRLIHEVKFLCSCIVVVFAFLKKVIFKFGVFSAKEFVGSSENVVFLLLVKTVIQILKFLVYIFDGIKMQDFVHFLFCFTSSSDACHCEGRGDTEWRNKHIPVVFSE